MKISGFLKKFVVTAAALCIFPTVALHASAQSAAELVIGGGDITVGDTFTVDIQMDTDEGEIYRYMGQLIYDDTMLKFDAQNSSKYDIINGDGGIVKIEGFTETPGDSVSVTVAFQAIADGNTVFSLANTALFSEDGTLLGQPVANTETIGILSGEPQTTAATTEPTTTTAATTTKPQTKSQSEPEKTTAPESDDSDKESSATEKTARKTNANQSGHQYKDLAVQVYIMLALVILIAAGLAFYWYRKKYGKPNNEKKPAKKTTTRKSSASSAKKKRTNNKRK